MSDQGVSLCSSIPKLCQGKARNSCRRCCPLPATTTAAAAAAAMRHCLAECLRRTKWIQSACLVVVKQEASKEDVGAIQGCLNLGPLGAKIPVAEDLDGSPRTPSCYLLSCLWKNEATARFSFSMVLHTRLTDTPSLKPEIQKPGTILA